MSEYPEGSYKFDPDTKSIAVRTRFPDDGPFTAHAWQVATIGDGGTNRSTAEVAAWIDIPPDAIAGLTPTDQGTAE